ncbi:MAG: 50S ribosomal protein L4 [Chitinophagales bacterium]|nr:50S ribosomal protein L4 [Chitinophagales bacterium]HAE13042.1 50S ribosomal protein L4 [Bacteroidota bacterium]MCB9022084.1 50S ribosomal protein L4 [Chitinophagales bacterium]MCB9031813.1 50S ribosomal protein L4 [Chitinophagales bacterium]HPE96661.1 50S ribosomal protein L4 [Chitinophagales bacterium]
MKLDVVNSAGQKTGRQVELSDAIFGIEPNDHSIYLSVKQYLANQRQGTHKSKERSEVAGSTRKLHRQKGTGGARKGDTKNPIFYGGGTIFGPKPRNYSFKLNRKVKELARRSALSYKAKNNEIIVIETPEMDKPSTRTYAGMLKGIGADGGRSLVVLSESNVNVVMSGRNIQRTEVATAADLNTYAILKAKHLVLTEQSVAAINQMAEQ